MVNYTIFLNAFTNKHRGSTAAYKVYYEHTMIMEDVFLLPNHTNVQSMLHCLCEAYKDIVVHVEENDFDGEGIDIRVLFRQHKVGTYTKNVRVSLHTTTTLFNKYCMTGEDLTPADIQKRIISHCKGTNQKYAVEKADCVKVLFYLVKNRCYPSILVEGVEQEHPVFEHLHKLMTKLWAETNLEANKQKQNRGNLQPFDLSGFV